MQWDKKFITVDFAWFWPMIMSRLRIQMIKIHPWWDFLMRKRLLSSGQKWFLRPYFPLIKGMFPLISSLRFSRMWGRTLSLTSVAFSSLSVRALPVPETKIWDHFSIETYPYIVGNMASETTFDHWKVFFSWGKVRKRALTQNPLMGGFWSLGIQFYLHFCARKSKKNTMEHFFLLMYVLPRCEMEVAPRYKLFRLLTLFV